MHTSLLRKSMVCGAIAILVLLSFTPIIDGINVMVENQSELTNEENNKNSIFTNADKNRLPRDISEKQLKNHLSRMRSYNLNSYRTCYYKSEFSMHETHDAFSDEEANIIETRIGSRDDYTPHDPISIDGDDDFTEENGVTGGTGTFDDPYIIEGWEIVTTTKPVAVKIIYTTAYFIVRNCFLNSIVFVVDFYKIKHGTIDNIVIPSGNPRGIHVGESSNVIIKNSTISSANCVWLDFSTQVSISNCNLSSSYNGISVYDSSFVVMSNLSVKDGDYGIYFFGSHNNSIMDCDVFSNGNGIEIIRSQHSVLRNNNLHDNTYGLKISSLDSLEDYYHDIDITNIIDGKPVYYIRNESNLVFDGSENIGLLGLIECDNITVKNFVMNNNAHGLILAGTKDSSVTGSTFSDNFAGIDCMFSSNNFFSDCTFTGGQGNTFFIVNSPNNVLRNNIISNVEWYKFGVVGEKLEDFLQDIDETNMIDGKPIYYIVGEKDMKFTGSQDIGYLALVNCENMEVINLELSYNEYGVLFANTTGVVRGCTFTSNQFGIEIFDTSQVTVSDCTVKMGAYGFKIFQSSDIHVTKCKVSSTFVGFYLNNSYGNLIDECDIFSNSLSGIRMEKSWSNIIRSNSFSNNGYGGINMNYDCWGNEICSNKIVNCYKGVGMEYSCWGNEVHHNTITGNDYIGVDVYESDDNSIHHNNIKNNDYGIFVAWYSNGTHIDHNNICNNNIGLIAFHRIVDARENWWGSKTGPGGIGPGSGDVIEEYKDATVYYEPWLESPVKAKPVIMSLYNLLQRLVEQFPLIARLLQI